MDHDFTQIKVGALEFIEKVEMGCANSNNYCWSVVENGKDLPGSIQNLHCCAGAP
jgi:hypothetical protein